jgi:glycine/D-amino acid oxidase-like deaminating enzyme
VLDRAGVSRATTGLGEGNVLVSDKLPGVERDLAVLGRDLWMDLDARFPEARVTRKGALVLDHPDGWLVGDLEPELAPGMVALHDPRELQVDPAALSRAMLRGIAVRENEEVIAVQPGRVTLATGERLTCGAVVVATGPWARSLTGVPVEPRKGYLVALKASRGLIRHKLLEASYADAAASAAGTLCLATVIEQTLDGDEVLVGSSRERVGFDTSVDKSVCRAMVDRATRFVPALGSLSVQRAWCGFRAWLPDGLPAIGPLDSDGVWTTTGHEGSGVGLGPISGLLLAQMIAGEPLECDARPFDPRRFDVVVPSPSTDLDDQKGNASAPRNIRPVRPIDDRSEHARRDAGFDEP